MTNNILTFGVTDLDAYPNRKHNTCCKEFMENDTLCIPCKKPDIEEIDSIHVSVCVKDFKVIKTIQGCKLIVEAIKKFKVMYTANTCDQSVHTAHWESHFCQFVLLPENVSLHTLSINDVFIGIEDIIVKFHDTRAIDVCALLIICPIIRNPINHPLINTDKCKCLPKNNDSCKEHTNERIPPHNNYIDKTPYENTSFNKIIYRNDCNDNNSYNNKITYKNPSFDRKKYNNDIKR